MFQIWGWPVIPLPVGQVGDIELLIRARHGLIVLDAADPQRAAVLFEYVADRMRLPHFVWKDGIGLLRTAPGMRPITPRPCSTTASSIATSSRVCDTPSAR